MALSFVCQRIATPLGNAPGRNGRDRSLARASLLWKERRASRRSISSGWDKEAIDGKSAGAEWLDDFSVLSARNRCGRVVQRSEISSRSWRSKVGASENIFTIGLILHKWRLDNASDCDQFVEHADGLRAV